MNIHIPNGRNEGIERRDETKARPEPIRANIKSYSSRSGIWGTFWHYVNSKPPGQSYPMALEAAMITTLAFCVLTKPASTQFQALSPAQLVVRPIWSTTTTASECLGNWTWWIKSWGNNILGSSLVGGRTPRDSLLKYQAYIFTPLNLWRLGSCWFLRCLLPQHLSFFSLFKILDFFLKPTVSF